ncbi:hypothetical protein [Peijinzhouia sedimentorum]
MAYNRDNYIKFAKHVREVYHSVKEEDIPDTRIVKHIFPAHNIFLSYRQWMNIKALRMNRNSDKQQISLFA